MLKESEFLKNTKIRILLFIEVLLILVGIVGLFGKSGVIVDRGQTDVLINEGVSLPAGVYTLKLYYDAEGTDPGTFGVQVQDAMYRSLLVNDVPLYAGISERECEFYLLNRTTNLKAVMNVAESVEIEGLELIATNKGSRIFLFWTILGCLLLNGILLLAMYHRKHPIDLEKQMVIFGVPLFALIASIPSMVDYNIMGTELIFHMQRIEALTQRILNGELSVRIESMWLAGHGYAASVFCGDTCLFVPALFRMVGMNMDSAYRLFLIVVNIATAWIAYISFAKCFNSRRIGVFGCALYTLAPYRMYLVYNKAAAGAFLAMIFLPLLVWGFYRIYTQDCQKKGYLWNWVIPVIGFLGMIQSHWQTWGMAGFFVILLCLILWKKTFRPRTILVLLLTVSMTIVINAWHLVPLWDLMSADQYYFGTNTNASLPTENAMVDGAPIGLGVMLLLSLGLWLVIRAKHKKEELSEIQKQERAAGDIGLALTVIALFMCTRYFPWEFMSDSCELFAMLAGSLQIPATIPAIVTILGVFVACVMGQWILREKEGLFTGKTVLVLLALVAMIYGTYQVNDIIFTKREIVRLYTAQSVASTEVSGAEYLPLGTDVGHMTYHDAVLSDGVSMMSYEKDGPEVLAAVETKEEGYVELPLLFYKGYQAKATENGEMLSVVKGDNGDVRVLLPAGFRGEVCVRYAGMWYWHVAEVVSLLVGSGLLLYYLTKKISLALKKG